MDDKDLITQEQSDLTATEKTMVDVEIARAVSQIQGAMTIAKKFPRDENQAISRIKSAAQRRRLAEAAEYEYKRGGSQITGLSIRAAEALAQAWGNFDTGIVELNRDSVSGESLVMAYAVDLEQNVWKKITFRVPHVRETREGPKRLKDSRDVYEHVMNHGSRRLRNCILASIPGDVADEFREECNRTMSKDDVPLKDRIAKMIPLFEEIGVSRAMIENTYGCKADSVTERQVAQLRRIYQSIKDGFGSIPDYFKVPQSDGGKAASLNAKVKSSVAPIDPIKMAETFDQFSGTTISHNPKENT